jgi:hypothetical protein
MEISNNIYGNQQMDTYINKNGFMKPKYPKILSYSPNIINGTEYIFSIRDVEVSAVTKIEIKLTLPEIKGVGEVSYIRNYPFLLIKNFDILIKNADDECFKLYETLDGEDLYSRFNITSNSKTYFNAFGGENDKFCSIQKGTYNDCVIFPSREIVIPICISNYCCYLYPTTEIEFRLKLFGLEEIIMFNTVFNDKSLKHAVTEFDTTSKNVKLNFTNTLIDSEHMERTHINLYRNVKTTCYENGAETLVSKNFKNAKHVSFYNRTNIFNESDVKFIIPFGPILKEKVLINNWVKRILKDLIIITDLDLTQNSVKELYGFSDRAEFKVVEDNRIFLDKEKSICCEIYINNIPEGHKIYYHTNILTFTRRFNKFNILNISNLFSFIRGIYFENKSVYYFMDDIEHSIEIYHISIPVNIWNDQNNTATGDLRSLKSKRNDFFYKNRFIYGMDILSKDTGFESVVISVGRDILTHYYQTTYENPHLLGRAEYNQYYNDENNFPNRLEFFTSHINETHFITADENINFNSIIASIKWKKYNDYDPLALYKKRPTLVVSQVYSIAFDAARRRVIIIEK